MYFPALCMHRNHQGSQCNGATIHLRSPRRVQGDTSTIFSRNSLWINQKIQCPAVSVFKICSAPKTSTKAHSSMFQQGNFVDVPIPRTSSSRKLPHCITQSICGLEKKEKEKKFYKKKNQPPNPCFLESETIRQRVPLYHYLPKYINNPKSEVCVGQHPQAIILHPAVILRGFSVNPEIDPARSREQAQKRMSPYGSS